MKNFIPSKKTSKTATSEFLIKILNSMKTSNEQFHLSEAEISLKLYKHFFQTKYLLSFQLYFTPGISLALWGSALDQKSYLSYIKRMKKRHRKLQTYFTLKFRLHDLHFNSQNGLTSHLVSWCSCNTGVIVDASSSPPVSLLKLL